MLLKSKLANRMPVSHDLAVYCSLLTELELLVPKKGLEPSHPCEYMDLNHARLPIPPLRLNGSARRGRQQLP
jgi:hypothetical protein